MRNIEELAAEEDERLSEERWERIQGICFILGWGLGLWGWYRFSQEHLGSGALAILASLICFAIRWNASKAVRISKASFWVGLLAGAGLFSIYWFTALPTFYWGNDPSFWLAVHAGAVVEPIWSPLAYLLGEAASFLFSTHVFAILPVLSGFVTALAVFVAAQEFLSQFRTKNVFNLIFVFCICWVMGLSNPFWNAGTMGLGLVSSLGLLLFLLQKHLLQLGKEQTPVSTFILGLLWSTHPLWGMAGTIAFFTPSGRDRVWSRKIFPLFLGLSPYLWIVLRSGKNFPSWGGSHPFFETIKETTQLLAVHFSTDWSWADATHALGWKIVVLLVLAGVLGLFNLFMGVEVSKKIVSTMDFWIWLFCTVMALFFYSDSTNYLGATSLWAVMGVAGFLSYSFDRRAGLGWGIMTKNGVGLLTLIGVLAALGLTWVTGLNYSRSDFFFPQQHALNLIRVVGPQTVLVCDDPFEFYAGLETSWMEPTGQPILIANKNYLDKRWYVEQWIEHQPQFLFSTITGPTDLILKSAILDNRDRWQIQWSRDLLPADWREPEASPAVLTQIFQSELLPVDPASVQYHYDFSLIPIRQEGMDERSSHYLSRYVEGFKILGQSLIYQKRYTDAIHAYDRAARLDPTDKETMAQLSAIYSQHNILEAAQLDYEAVVKDHSAALEKMLKSLEQAQKNKDEGKVTDCLGQIVHLNTELADAQYQLSKIYDHQGRTQEAKALLEASVAENPKQIEAQMTLGHSFEKTGDWRKAEEAFRSVIAVDPQNKEAQVELWKLLNKPKS